MAKQAKYAECELMKTFRVVIREMVVCECFIEAESAEQVEDLLIGEGNAELVTKAEEAQIQAEILDDDSEVLSVEEVQKSLEDCASSTSGVSARRLVIALARSKVMNSFPVGFGEALTHNDEES